MRVLTPLETAWPAGVTLLLLLLALWRSRRELRLPPGWTWAVLILLFVRVVWIPGLTGHIYDGHEADYYDLFRGVRLPTRGGTVLYPAMQWLWYGLGKVTPPWAWAPVVFSLATSVAAAGALAGAIGLLAGRTAGWFAFVVVALHPTHAAWSTSAYNVMLPHLLCCLSLWAAARLSTGEAVSNAVGWLGASAFALAVATRLESVLVLWPCAILLLSHRSRGPWLGAAVFGAALAAAAGYPLVWPGELPGDGGRAMSFAANRTFFPPLVPYDSWVGIGLWLVGCGSAFRRWPKATLAFGLLPVVQHLVMATFDDYGARHALISVAGFAWSIGAGAVALGRWGALLPGLAAFLSAIELTDLRPRFYGEEEAYHAVLEAAPYAELPRMTLKQAVREDCGWIAEDHRSGSSLSHFNVLDVEEAARHRGADGCLRWCVETLDWSWSSRGVRDRAQRLAHLYSLEPMAVVRDPSSGYGCLLVNIGARRSGTVPGAAGDTHFEEHGPGRPGDSRLP